MPCLMIEVQNNKSRLGRGRPRRQARPLDRQVGEESQIDGADPAVGDKTKNQEERNNRGAEAAAENDGHQYVDGAIAALAKRYRSRGV